MGKLIGLAAVAMLGGLVASQHAEIRRYLKIERM
jgi:hypothetical protein